MGKGAVYEPKLCFKNGFELFKMVVTALTLYLSVMIPFFDLIEIPAFIYNLYIFALAHFSEMFIFYDLPFVELMQIFFILYLPSFTIVFVYLPATYFLFPIIFLTSFNCAILHVLVNIEVLEIIESLNAINCVYFLCLSLITCFHLCLHRLKPFYIMDTEKDSKYLKYLNACIVILGWYAYIVYKRSYGWNEKIVSLAIIFSSLLLGLVELFELPNLFILVLKKFIIVSLVLFCIVSNYKRGNKVVLGNMVCFLSITVLAQCIYVRMKIGIKFSAIFFLPDKFKLDGDKYVLDLNTKKAELYKKGNQNNIIKPYIMYEDTKFTISSFSLIFDRRYTQKTLLVQNIYFYSIFKKLENKISIKCTKPNYELEMRLGYLWEFNRIRLLNGCEDIINTEKNICLKNKFELLYCPKRSRHLSIRETCFSIRPHACSSCYHIKYIYFPASVIRIGDYAFADCYELRRIRFHKASQLISIGTCSFESTGLKIVIFPMSIEFIGDNSFIFCQFLRKVILPENPRLISRINKSFCIEPNLKIEYRKIISKC